MDLFGGGKSKDMEDNQDKQDLPPQEDPPPYDDVVSASVSGPGSAGHWPAMHSVQPQTILPPNHGFAALGYSAPAPVYSSPVPRQFPPAFSIYRDPFSWTLTIGLHRDATPLYAVSRHFGLTDKPTLMLHSGPNATYPVMAAMAKLPLTRDRTITMPPLPNSPYPSSQITLHVESGILSIKWRFDIEAGFPGRLERYEWRRNRSDGIANFGVDGTAGWKLLRLDSRPPNGAPPSTMYHPVAGSSTSDGAEVVAVWSLHSMSLSKAGMFSFSGTGSSGLLGERWAVMAVITALTIMDFEQHRR